MKKIYRYGRGVKELLSFFWARRLFWLIPFLFLLLLSGALIILSQTPYLAPFIYTLF